MNREIKFRVWVKKHEHMSSNFSIGDGSNDMFKSDSVEFMQFTGLKDINGVEIYEGDVVTAGIRGGNVLSTYVIQWDSVYGCWYGNLVKTCELGNIDCRPLGEIRFNANIIGNIHQNPELLK